MKLGIFNAMLVDCKAGKKRKFELVLTPQTMMDILCEYSVPELHQKAAECDIPMLARLAEIMCDDADIKMSVYSTPPDDTIAMLLELATFIVSGGKSEKKPVTGKTEASG